MTRRRPSCAWFFPSSRQGGTEERAGAGRKGDQRCQRVVALLPVQLHNPLSCETSSSASGLSDQTAAFTAGSQGFGPLAARLVTRRRFQTRNLMFAKGKYLEMKTALLRTKIKSLTNAHARAHARARTGGRVVPAVAPCCICRASKPTGAGDHSQACESQVRRVLARRQMYEELPLH